MSIWVRTLKPFCFYDDHPKGEVFKVSYEQLNELMHNQLVEVVVNKAGDNLPYEEYAGEVLFPDSES